jgi:hypothetical protein
VPGSAAETELKCCVYCSQPLRLAREHREFNQTSRSEFISTLGWQCIRCGWWLIKKHHYFDDDIRDNEIQDKTIYHEGAIALFDVKWGGAALNGVEEELWQYRKKLSDISPREFERLIGILLGSKHKCDVRHVGRTPHDGGIDLILLLGDQYTAVQVKHRSIYRKQRGEGVVPLREFVGAMFPLSGVTQGIFVTSAEFYSKDAEQYAKDVSLRMPLNLMSVGEVKEHLRLLKKHQWERYDDLWAQIRDEVPDVYIAFQRANREKL